MDEDAGADSDAVDVAAMVGYTAVILFEWTGCINLAALTMIKSLEMIHWKILIRLFVMRKRAAQCSHVVCTVP